MYFMTMENSTHLQLLNESGVSKVCRTLEELNASKANQRSPTVIFLCVLIAIGIIGNTVVIIVYSTKYHPSTFRLYIITLGVIDLLSCCIAIPIEVVDNAYPLMFYMEGFCKVGRFLGQVFKIASAFVLVVIAVERYKKICHPFDKPTTLFQARLCCATAVILAVGLSWPNAIVQGLSQVPLPCNLTGYDCTVDDEMRNTKYPFAYYILLFVVYLVVFLLLTILYSLVIISLRKQDKNEGQHNFTEKKNKINPRITKLMIAITVVFIVCYLPDCILDAFSAFLNRNIFPPSPIVLGTLPLLARMFFINNVSNPFLYLIGETKFRNIIKQYLRWVFYTICRPNKLAGNGCHIEESFGQTETTSSK